MFDNLLESSRRDDSSKQSNIGFDEEIIQLESIEVHFTHIIWSFGNIQNSDHCHLAYKLSSKLDVNFKQSIFFSQL